MISVGMSDDGKSVVIHTWDGEYVSNVHTVSPGYANCIAGLLIEAANRIQKSSGVDLPEEGEEIA